MLLLRYPLFVVVLSIAYSVHAGLWCFSAGKTKDDGHAGPSRYHRCPQGLADREPTSFINDPGRLGVPSKPSGILLPGVLSSDDGCNLVYERRGNFNAGLHFGWAFAYGAVIIDAGNNIFKFYCMEATYGLRNWFDKNWEKYTTRLVPYWLIQCPPGYSIRIRWDLFIPIDDRLAFIYRGVKEGNIPYVNKGSCKKDDEERRIIINSPGRHCLDVPDRIADDVADSNPGEQDPSRPPDPVLIVGATTDRHGNPVAVDNVRIEPKHQAEPSDRDADHGEPEEPLCPCPEPGPHGESLNECDCPEVLNGPGATMVGYGIDPSRFQVCIWLTALADVLLQVYILTQAGIMLLPSPKG